MKKTYSIKKWEAHSGWDHITGKRVEETVILATGLPTKKEASKKLGELARSLPRDPQGRLYKETSLSWRAYTRNAEPMWFLSASVEESEQP